MRKLPFHFLVFGFFILAASGCATNGMSSSAGYGRPNVQSVPEVDETHLIKTTYEAVDRILREVEGSRLQFSLSRHKPIIVTSLVDIDNLRRSSTLGRILGEQVGSRFAQSNYPVVEVKMRPDALLIKEETGELILSRNMQNLSFEHDAQAVIAGTYAIAKEHIYVTLKVLRAKDGIIVYSYDYRLPMSADIKRLISERRRRL